MKFRNYINEIFDNPYDYKTKDNSDGLVFKFKSEDGGKSYTNFYVDLEGS